jgi:hypothetical protein
MKALNLSLVWFIFALTFASPQGSGLAQTGDELTQSTAHYRITLEIGPVPTIPRPDQAASAIEGEVPLSRPGVPMPTVAMTDQGQPVNCHIEVAVYDKATGAPLRNAMSRITITERKTGRSRALRAVTAIYDPKEKPGDLPYSDDVHLANGAYRVIVFVGGEQTVFKKVAVGRP